MAYRTSIAKSAILLTLANLIIRSVSMLFQVYLTGQIGAVGIGLMQLIMTVYGFSLTVGTSGLRVAAMYLSAEEYGLRRPEGIRQAMAWCLGTGVVLSAAVGGTMAAGADWLALYWVKDLRAAASLRLLGISLPLSCISAILTGYFTAVGQVGRLVAVEIADRIVTVAATVWLLGLGVSSDLSHACLSVVGGGALASVGSVAVLLVMLLRNFRGCEKEKQPLSMSRRLRKLCVPVALNDYLRSGLGTLEQFLIPYGLTRFGGSRTGALGSYGIIQGMVFPVMMFPTVVLFAVADLLIPELARSKAENRQNRIRRMTEVCLQKGVVFSGVIAGLLLVLADPLGLLLYGSTEAGLYLRLFAPLVPVLYLDCIVDGMHKGLGQQVYCVRVNTLTNLLDVVGLFLLLPRWGIGGYLFTYAVTHCINFYLSLRRLLQISGAEPGLRTLAKVFCGTAAAVIFCRRVLPMAATWFHVFMGGGIYLILCGVLLSKVLAVSGVSRYNQKKTPGGSHDTTTAAASHTASV